MVTKFILQKILEGLWAEEKTILSMRLQKRINHIRITVRKRTRPNTTKATKWQEPIHTFQ